MKPAIKLIKKRITKLKGKIALIEKEEYKDLKGYIAQYTISFLQKEIKSLNNAKHLLVENNVRTIKPPLGLTPRFIRDEKRFKEIKQAIDRYEIKGSCVPEEWLIELNEIYDSIRNHKKKHEI